MKKILIAYSDLPFEGYRWSELAQILSAIISSHNTQCEIFSLPFIMDESSALRQITGYQLLSTADYADYLICLGNPSQILSHSKKIVFLEETNFFQSISNRLAWLDISILDATLRTSHFIFADKNCYPLQKSLENSAFSSKMKLCDLISLFQTQDLLFATLKKIFEN